MHSLSQTRLPVVPSGIDRDAATRLAAGRLVEVLSEPATRVLVFRRGSVLSSDSHLVLCAPTDFSPGVLDAHDLVYLGRSSQGVAHFALTVAQEMEPDALVGDASGSSFVSLRRLAQLLSGFEAELVIQASAVLNWHGSHGFSPRTGVATTVVEGGWVRRAAEPDHDIYPRIDPSVIVAVLDADDRLLLGSNAAWEANRFSLLAGFVEPGETLEGAVSREIFEESGIHVTDVHYLGSQPWPFPASLMLGFAASADPERVSQLTPDGVEIVELRWFSREELSQSLDDIILPGRLSIARAIIELWFGGPIPDGTAVGRPR